MMFSWRLPLCYKTKKSPAQQGFSLYPYRSITPIFTAQNISPRFSAAAYCLASATMRVLFGPIPDGHSDCAKALHQVLFCTSTFARLQKIYYFPIFAPKQLHSDVQYAIMQEKIGVLSIPWNGKLCESFACVPANHLRR